MFSTSGELYAQVLLNEQRTRDATTALQRMLQALGGKLLAPESVASELQDDPASIYSVRIDRSVRRSDVVSQRLTESVRQLSFVVTDCK